MNPPLYLVGALALPDDGRALERVRALLGLIVLTERALSRLGKGFPLDDDLTLRQDGKASRRPGTSSRAQAGSG